MPKAATEVVLVDTNIVGNLLLQGAQAAAARALYARDADWRSEPLLFIELTNLLATAVRVGGVAPVTARSALAEAHLMLDDGMLPMADADVLAAASRYGVSGYDARFLCLAVALGTSLVTEDAALRRKAPKLTQSLADALDG